uniref:CHAP domain-containing protein n=1 Tax=Nonomuraea pusilla TaxID=46177 RepID=UPI0022A9416D|nr:CHAP domain-containing protein [Nonomuraea pusilla]
MNQARRELGYKEKKGQFTKFGQWYADRVQDPQYRDAPWCDMFIAWAADKAGISDYVGQFAWTPSHAAWFIQQGAWTRQPEPGALVFFDWRGGKNYKGVDHVGIVERVDGKKIHTIEANVDGVWLKRKTRDTDKVVGYGLPRVVKANVELAGIRSTEQPFVRATPRAEPQGSSPLDLIGTPPALLGVMVLATVLLSLRFSRRRGTHRRPAQQWNEPTPMPAQEPPAEPAWSPWEPAAEPAGPCLESAWSPWEAPASEAVRREGAVRAIAGPPAPEPAVEAVPAPRGGPTRRRPYEPRSRTSA